MPHLDVLKTIITSIGEVQSGVDTQLRYPKVKIAFPEELDIYASVEVANSDLNIKIGVWLKMLNPKTVTIFGANEENLATFTKKGDTFKVNGPKSYWFKKPKFYMDG